MNVKAGWLPFPVFVGAEIDKPSPLVALPFQMLSTSVGAVVAIPTFPSAVSVIRVAILVAVVPLDPAGAVWKINEPDLPLPVPLPGWNVKLAPVTLLPPPLAPLMMKFWLPVAVPPSPVPKIAVVPSTWSRAPTVVVPMPRFPAESSAISATPDLYHFMPLAVLNHRLLEGDVS